MSATEMPQATTFRNVRRATLWHDDESFRTLAPDTPIAPGEVCWFDIDAEADPQEVVSDLERFCGGELEHKHVADLLDVNAVGCTDYEGREVRLVRAMSVKAIEPKEGEDHTPQVGTLMIEPVFILAGNGWMLTCWHAQRCFHGKKEVSCGGAPVAPLADCLGAVERRWTHAKLGLTAGDLGMMLLHELALTFAPAHRALSAWHEDWEVFLYRDGRVKEHSLSELWGCMQLMRDWISPLNRPGMRADVDKAWFRHISDPQEVERVDDRIDKALSNLAGLGRLLRASFAARQSHIEEQRQRRIEKIAAIFLVPTLVVGFYGANTKLPGGNHWSGFVEMLGAMVLLTTLAVIAVRRAHRGPA